MQKLVSNVVSEKNLRIAQLRALKLFSDTIENTFGPSGNFTAYSKYYTDKKTLAVSNYTKDGCTVLKNIQIDKPIESLLKDEIIDICTHVIKSVGDGTSSAVMLSYLIFKALIELRYNTKDTNTTNSKDDRYTKREITETFKEVLEEAISIIETQGRPCTLEDIYNIALTSTNGNAEMSTIIHNIYKDYGMDVFVDVQGSNTVETIVKGYDGLVYQSGYLDPCFINNEQNHTCDLVNPHIYIFESPIDTPEMIKILSLIVKKEITEPTEKALDLQKKNKPINIFPKPTLIICPFISRDANSYIDSLIKYFTQTPISARQHFCIVSNLNSNPEQLIDIMKLTGAKFIKKYIDPDQYKADQIANLAPNEINIKTFYGSAEKVIIDAISMKIINAKEIRDENNVLTDFYKNYISELQDTLKKYEETRQDLLKIGNLKRRIHTLKGNLVDLYVGGIGSSDRQSLNDSVEDAILNCRSAAQDGVVYGANYAGLIGINKLYNNLTKEYNTSDHTKKETLKYKVCESIRNSYIELICKLYYECYNEDIELTKNTIMNQIDSNMIEKHGPLNIITNTYDETVLTSAKTDISILESISRIISILFNTNQFLVPDPRFNIYNFEDELEDEPIMTINDQGLNIKME